MSSAERPGAARRAPRRPADPATPDVAQRGEPPRISGHLRRAALPPTPRVSPTKPLCVQYATTCECGAESAVPKTPGAPTSPEADVCPHPGWVPGPSVPISEDGFKIATKASGLVGKVERELISSGEQRGELRKPGELGRRGGRREEGRGRRREVAAQLGGLSYLERPSRCRWH